MFGSQRSLLARHIGPVLVIYLAVFPCFSKTAPRCSDPGIYFFSAMSLRCLVCPRYLNSVTHMKIKNAKKLS